MKRFNFYLPEQATSALKAIAERTGLTVSELIRRAVDEYINRNRMAKK